MRGKGTVSDRRGVRGQMGERVPACNMGFCVDGRASDDAEMCVHVSKEVRRGACKCGG
jgi:hypothetical protein